MNGETWFTHAATSFAHQSYFHAIASIDKKYNDALLTLRENYKTEYIYDAKEKLNIARQAALKQIDADWRARLNRIAKHQSEKDIGNLASGGATAYNFSNLNEIRECILSILSCDFKTFAKKIRSIGMELFLDNNFATQTSTILKNHTSDGHTLMPVWLGANDLITFLKEPSLEQVEKSLRDYEKNISELKNTKNHIILFKLPAIEDTPRYRKADKKTIQLLRDCEKAFNEGLEKIAKKYDCDVIPIDVGFEEILKHPEKYGLNPENVNKACVNEGSCPINGDLAPAKGDGFFNDVHPSADVHAWIAELFLEFIKERFNILFLDDQKAVKEFSNQIDSLLNTDFLLKHKPGLQNEFGMRNNLSMFNHRKGKIDIDSNTQDCNRIRAAG